MKKEDKDLLLKDLCARIPYGVKIQGFNPDREVIIEELSSIGVDGDDMFDCNMIELSDVKPYLFPLSSMTEKQEEELEKLLGDSVAFKYNEWFYDMDGYSRICLSNVQTAIDWFNKNHFDCRGLIGKELAIDATGLNIY